MKTVGVTYGLNKSAVFRVWAPFLENISLHILHPLERRESLCKDKMGYWEVSLDDLPAGTKYVYHFNGRDWPDPASHHQAEDVLGPSFVVDHDAFEWKDHDWKGIPLEEMIIYELHIGTFTPQGTFEAAIERINYLKGLGINAVELMPVAQFPGDRNWGYDGVFPYAVQHSYGGPEGLKRFVDACHSEGLAVILDVVYNHLGPEGNVLPSYMPCFTSKYKTPWGDAINYDDEYSYGVRDFFLGNAAHWLEHYHIDALRLDAVHGIYDQGGKHFLAELAEIVGSLPGRKRYLIAESDLNDRRTISPLSQGGMGMDAQWSDDLHHCIHTLLTKEDRGYYLDFGSIEHLAKAYAQGFVYTWEYSPSRKRFHGSMLPEYLNAGKLVVCSQNHDQVGNRAGGDRLSSLVSFEALKVAASSVIFSPFIPMLFMGEEYAEKSPFLYFMSFYDKDLIHAVREGRKKEFASFSWDKEPTDPYSTDTFNRSKLKWNKDVPHRNIFDYYRHSIALRKQMKALSNLSLKDTEVHYLPNEKTLAICRTGKGEQAMVVLNYDSRPHGIEGILNINEWELLLDSCDEKWAGPGPLPGHINGLSCQVYGRKA